MRRSVILLACPVALAIAVGFWCARSVAAEPDLPPYCAKVGDDDTVRPPPLALRAALQRAYTRLLGGASADDQFLLSNGQVRCMGGKLLVCFTGANLPCAKINAARTNPGADEWCRAHPGDDNTPFVAIGHDSLYGYGCDGTRARITGTNWTLDRRGFAATLWTPLD